nr:hypothetical protein [Candidatus Woesearchaeota archaeon]
MNLQFYPYDFEYKIEGEKTYVYMYAKLEDGTKVCIRHEHQAFFYATKDLKLEVPDRKRIAKVTHTEPIEMDLLGKKKSLFKIYVNYPKAVSLLSKEFAKQSIQTYEQNILFIHRYLRDLQITPMTLVEAEGEFIETTKYRVPLFLATNIKDLGKEAHHKWKILAVDIETYAKKKEIDPHNNPILMIALYGVNEDGEISKKVITWRKFKHNLDYLEVVSDEVEMLKRFREIVVDYQPDILTGYFSDGFDLPYINTRAEKYKVNLNLGLDQSDLQIRGNQGMKKAEARISGMLHIDVLKFVRNIFGGNLQTDSYSLNAVAEELLGHKKHDVNLDDLAHIWDNKPDDLTDFCEYNLHDAHLTYKLCHQLLPDMIEFTKIVGLPSYDVIRMRFSRLVESFIMKNGVKQNILAPNKATGREMEQRMTEQVQGAFVFEPTPGLYKDVVIFDYRSLYPTIISAHNIGPEGLRCNCCKHNVVPGREQFWFCEKEKKFLPSVIGDIVNRRMSLKRFIKKEKSEGKDTKILEARSYALKILANSFYGYLGFYGARWYSLESAASTTAYARHYIKQAIEKAEEKGFKVIYADTDSCFLILGSQVMDDAMTFMKEVNTDLPGEMELEYEGHFSRGIFVAVKGSDKGAKKKYALMREDGTMKITGFEFVRRNWSPYAKETQKHLLELVVQDKEQEAVDYVKERIEELNEGKVSIPKLTLKTQITREISQYTSRGPHVIVAQQMIAKGEPVPPGTMVEYVIGKGSGLVRERAGIPSEVTEYDSEYYLNHQLLPAVSSILLVLGYSEEELLGKGKQTGLGAFFNF